MTRKEEINKASYKALETNYLMEDSKNSFLEGFNIGAEWADKTMIEKACKWFEGVRLDYYAEHTEEFIENFKKAMED